MTVLQQVSQVAFAVFIQVTWSHGRGHVRAARRMRVGRRNGRYRGASKEGRTGRTSGQERDNNARGDGRTPTSRATTMIGQQFKIRKSYGEKKKLSGQIGTRTRTPRACTLFRQYTLRVLI